MKKILVFIFCAVLICVATVSVYAEDEIPDAVTPDEVVEENVPPTEEDAAGSENPGEEVIPDDTTADETVPEETPTEPVETPTEPTPEATDPVIPDETLPIEPEEPEVELTGPEKIVEFIKIYFEEISVIITLLLTVVYNVRKHKVLNKSIATLNNNSVTIADNSNNAMQDALAKVGGMSSVVGEYKDEIVTLLTEIRKNAEEKQKLESKLEEVDRHLAQSKAANIEFANELAELLVLANIPNSKKDELYARHLAALDAIAEKENAAVTNAVVTEVNTDGIEGQE